MKHKGRPALPDEKKKRSVSISITPLNLQILRKICEEDGSSRSEAIGKLIENSGYLELGITGGIAEHILPWQKYKLKKTGIMVCNPYNKGPCSHPSCERGYTLEGLQ